MICLATRWFALWLVLIASPASATSLRRRAHRMFGGE
jgi:hypothetical protein